MAQPEGARNQSGSLSRHEPAVRMDACPGGRQLALAAPDPFDRLPAGQAIVEQYDLLSVDAAFDGLGVSRFWK